MALEGPLLGRAGPMWAIHLAAIRQGFRVYLYVQLHVLWNRRQFTSFKPRSEFLPHDGWVPLDPAPFALNIQHVQVTTSLCHVQYVYTCMCIAGPGFNGIM